MRFPDVVFDVGYRAKTGVWGECSDFNGRKMFARSGCFQGVPYSECYLRSWFPAYKRCPVWRVFEFAAR